MELYDAIKIRRSIRKYKDTPIADEVINEMLEAARLAPSAGNVQNHVFGVIKDIEIKLKLAEAAGNQMWIATAPVIFACCADISWDIATQSNDDFGLIVNKLRFGNEFVEYMQSYKDRETCMTLFNNACPLIPADHIFLIATSYGLSACFVGYLNIKKANEILKLPSHITCLFLLPVGYKDEIPSEKELKKINEIIFYDQWKLSQP